MNEKEFKQLNDQRLTTLRILSKETSEDGELCDAWQSSGHIADYRAWETQRKRVIEADEQHQHARQAMVDAGLLPQSHF